MEVLVTGASGFIGSRLRSALISAGHRPIVAVRGREVPAGVDGIAWNPEDGTIDAQALDGVGGVVHLAGAGIGDRRWTASRKQLILESRTKSTGLLASTVAGLVRKPSVFVSSSAVGYYGDRGDEVLTEDSAAGEDFTAQVCRQWEAAAAPVADAGIRLVTIRTGIVLGRAGGMLARVLPPFRMGLGGRLGSGRQYLSWVSLDDEVAAILRALEQPALTGAANITAPTPVTNAEFTATLGRVLHRPARLPTPLAPLRAVYGRELVKSLLLGGQRVLPAALTTDGFEFAHPTLERALRAVLDRPDNS
ncbi:MAG TPA: TIGR01777 family oxidoreductase [Acidimicrobiia bacterium]|nr:TIGR01777 family oxidoreductase [Acidimicrobiia bacterium]